MMPCEQNTIDGMFRINSFDIKFSNQRFTMNDFYGMVGNGFGSQNASLVNHLKKKIDDAVCAPQKKKK